ncbi:hypothetical protein RhiirC2_775628 [Rhizophagus irregularis]|uniref:Uncharacterized protein n=1 Tax=Rhizophagus irregularis TaxID=588596 RepID=A0A2N1NIK6_9GLOM|nr:hypothetical protein RhiirC2_775628 [Rhizophagus irregularis]
MYQNQQQMYWIARAFRIKSFMQSLPTYEVLYQRKVYGISSEKCVRCNEETETWDHMWKCTKNKFILFDLWKDAVNAFIELKKGRSEEILRFGYIKSRLFIPVRKFII